MFFRRKPRAEAPVLHATDADFETVIGAPGLTVVDFWAPWCMPCRVMEPILDEIATEYADRGVRVVKVNSDQAPETSGRFGIRSIPTVMFFLDGEPEFEMVGLVPKPVLQREIEEVLGG